MGPTAEEAEALAWAEGRRLDANSRTDPEPHAKVLASGLRRRDAVIEKMREALKSVLNDPVIGGMSARIKNCAKLDRKDNPLDLARAALVDSQETSR